MPISQQTLDAFRARLKSRRHDLLQAEESGRETERVVELDQSRVGRLSRMDALQNQAISRETGQRRRQALRQVESALLRIDRGEFGDCLHCGEPINPRRLEADPTALLCIDCAEATEG
jgi:DnaK suppressor protein